MNNTLAIALLVLGATLSLVIKSTGQGRLDGSLEALGPIKVGAAAPDVELESLDGKRMKLSALRGRVTLLEFGATWCGPCRGMLRPLRELAGQPFQHAVTVASVHVGESRSHVEAYYARRRTGKLQLLVDEEGEAAERFGVQSFPTVVLLDVQGNVRLIHVGAFYEMDSVKEHIERWVR